MPCTGSVALIALLVFGFQSVVWADTTWAANDAATPFNAGQKGAFAASPLVPSAPFCRGGSSDRTKPWIELTGPGGEPVHINVVQIVSIRPDTEVPGARTQLDLASGKSQRVRENVGQVMQLISASSDTREVDEGPGAAPKLCRFN